MQKCLSFIIRCINFTTNVSDFHRNLQESLSLKSFRSFFSLSFLNPSSCAQAVLIAKRMSSFVWHEWNRCVSSIRLLCHLEPPPKSLWKNSCGTSCFASISIEIPKLPACSSHGMCSHPYITFPHKSGNSPWMRWSQCPIPQAACKIKQNKINKPYWTI